MPTKSCLTCGYRSLNATKCPLIGYSYTSDRNQVCPYYTHELPTCGLCGRVDPQVSFVQKSDGTFIYWCGDCKSKSGTCGLCSKSSECCYETDPSPLPKAVLKSFKQGNMITQVQIKNPDRIDITCRVNCQCFSEEFGCLRENGTCGNYEGVF